MANSAVISSCGKYRYYLERQFDSSTKRAVFVLLNPSTADATQDDPTIRRCVGFARQNGAGTLSVVNLYALRATQPRELLVADDPVGPDNDDWIAQAVRGADIVIAAWGAYAANNISMARHRVATVIDLLGPNIHCLGVTKAGHPAHPLYLRRSTPLVLWRSRCVACAEPTVAGSDYCAMHCQAPPEQRGGWVSNFRRNGQKTQRLQDRLPAIIAQEDPERPLLDQEIVNQLKAEGINVSTWSVSRCRRELGIPNARGRKAA